MDFNQLELRRETLFKDAVLTSADAKSMQIIAAAQQKSSQALAEARKSCVPADYELVAAGLKRDAEREYSATLQQGRRELLQYRGQLADELFAEVERRLADFAAGKGYAKWLAARAAAHAEDLAGAAAPLVRLRQADMAHAAAVEKALPGCRVEAAPDIRLGGLKISDGHRMYDETLDRRLADEKQRFTLESGLLL